MRIHPLSAVLTVILSLAINGFAMTRYVDASCASPAAPYTNWATAATNIQDAVDVADAGDQILVTNGIYQTGGRVVPPYLLTNRVVLDKPVTVQSVNGSDVTTIQGYQMPGTNNGDGAVRCAYLADGAAMIGNTLPGKGNERAEVNPRITL